MNKILAGRTIFILVVIGIYSFSSVFSISHTHESNIHSHSSHAETAGCVYMIGEQGLCSMDMFDHLSIWQSFSSAYIPTLSVILFAISILLIILIFSPPPKKFYFATIYRPSLYQTLFSRGVLNSKVF